MPPPLKRAANQRFTIDLTSGSKPLMDTTFALTTGVGTLGPT